MSLSPQTRRIRNRIAQWTRQGRKHWDLYRYLLDPHLLCDALRLVVRNGGAAGPDGVKIEDVKGREWEFAVKWSEELRAGRYQPSAVRRVYIPKKDGDKRPLGIPGLRDRCVQRALTLLMECIYEQKFHDFSFGFRPKRRAVDCAAIVAKAVYSNRQVLEADITKFFDQVSHNLLLRLIEKEIVDPRILRLIHATLKAGSQELQKPWEPSLEGAPQGGPLSPLLANIYLHYLLDEKFVRVFGGNQRVQLFRYADDFVIVSVSRGAMKAARRLLYAWMKDAGLELKEEKTKEIDMSNHARGHGSKFNFLGFKFHLRSYRDNPDRYWIARQPSEKARKQLREALRERMQAHLHPTVVREKLKSTWLGWCEYFRHSNANRIFYRECDSLHRLTWWYLRRKFRRTRRPVGWSRLQVLHDDIMLNIRPLSVRADHLRDERQHAFCFG